MRSLAALLAALAAMPVAAAAAADKATFKVSLYGVQRYEEQETRFEDPDSCFDDRGTRTSESEVRFTTRRPVRATVWLERGYVEVDWRGDGDVTIPVKVSFKHSGSDDIEVETLCRDEWRPRPELPPGDCAETTDAGFSLSITPKRIEATGERSLVLPIEPFKGCQFGDLSGDLYPAKQRFSVRELLDNGQTQVILRGRDDSHYETGASTSDTRKRTTIYVTFKKVGK